MLRADVVPRQDTSSLVRSTFQFNDTRIFTSLRESPGLERARAADPLTWYDAVDYAKTHHAALGDNAPTVAVVAVNRLEETGEIVLGDAGFVDDVGEADPQIAHSNRQAK